MSLDNLSIQELQTLISQAQKEIERRKKSQRSQALAELKKVALSHGYDLNELLGGEAVAAPERKRTPAKAKYRNPDDASQTWTGRGLKPKWLAAKLAQGATVESFLIAQ